MCYLTLSGSGEPTLASNLGQMIKSIRRIRGEKIAVLTNSSLMDREDVKRDLSLADFVIAKLDAHTQEVFKLVNRPVETAKIEKIARAIKDFKDRFEGKLALQVMFIEQNKRYAGQIARIAREINPDEVQINTPLRPCRAAPLTRAEIAKIENHFDGMSRISVYNAQIKPVIPISTETTLKRRGKL